MITPVLLAECSLPEISVKEVLRYAGEKSPRKETLSLLDECISECVVPFGTKVAYRIFPIRRDEKSLWIANLQIHSKDLAKNLEKCDHVILFAACAGLGIDRLIKKYSSLSPAKALLFHSIGAERVEALSDAFCEKISLEGKIITAPRFSPGYGDLPLEIQKEILTLLNADKTVGICLNESMLLSPTKSVTAFVGIEK